MIDDKTWTLLIPGPRYLRPDGGTDPDPGEALRLTQDEAMAALASVRRVHPGAVVVVPGRAG